MYPAPCFGQVAVQTEAVFGLVPDPRGPENGDVIPIPETHTIVEGKPLKVR